MPRLCHHSGCDRWAQRGGVCVAHGAKLEKCRFEGGCDRHIVQGGLCVAHGANKKRCAVDECNKHVFRKGVCRAHLASLLQCEVADCTKNALKGQTTCASHKFSRRCGLERCRKYAKEDGICSLHSFHMEKCCVMNCERWAKINSLCLDHYRRLEGGSYSGGFVNAPAGSPSARPFRLRPRFVADTSDSSDDDVSYFQEEQNDSSGPHAVSSSSHGSKYSSHRQQRRRPTSTQWSATASESLAVEQLSDLLLPARFHGSELLSPRSSSSILSSPTSSLTSPLTPTYTPLSPPLGFFPCASTEEQFASEKHEHQDSEKEHIELTLDSPLVITAFQRRGLWDRSHYYCINHNSNNEEKTYLAHHPLSSSLFSCFESGIVGASLKSTTRARSTSVQRIEHNVVGLEGSEQSRSPERENGMATFRGIGNVCSWTHNFTGGEPLLIA